MKIYALVAAFVLGIIDRWKVAWNARKRAKDEGRIADYERADEVRRRAESSDADERLREWDDAGYRD